MDEIRVEQFGHKEPVRKIEVPADSLQERARVLKEMTARRVNGTVVFDIDGVLADSRWRLPLIRRKDRFKITIHFPDGGEQELEYEGPRDERRWEDFYSNMIADRTYEEGAALLRTLRRTFVIEFWTGRPERFRAKTLAWLAEHDLLPLGTQGMKVDSPEFTEWSRVWLMMRGDQSRKKAAILKTDWLVDFREEDLPDPVMLFDDDPDVVTAFNFMGVPATLPIWHGEGVERVRG